MKSYRASDDFTDADLELGLAAAVAATPDLYWAVLDAVPEGAFAFNGGLWRQIAEAVESERQPLPVMRKVIKDGVEADEPVPPVPDPDAAASKLADLYQRRLLAELHQNQMQRLRSEEPAGTLIADLEAGLIEVSRSVRETRQGSLLWGSDLIKDVIGQAEAAQKRKEETGSTIAGLSTGFKKVDEYLNGLAEGLYIVAGPPAFGKTTLVLQIAVGAAERVPVIYVTFENSPANLVLKCICRLSGIVPADVERGIADLGKLREGAHRFQPAATRIAFLEGTTKTSVAMVRGKALQAMRRHKCDTCLIVVDYLQRMAHQEGFQSLRENVSTLTLQLTELAHRLRSPVLAVASQSRQGYQAGKTNAFVETLKESGDLEYSADVIVFIEKSKDNGSTPMVRNCKLKIAKNRYGQADVEVPVTFKPGIGEFRETIKTAGAER